MWIFNNLRCHETDFVFASTSPSDDTMPFVLLISTDLVVFFLSLTIKLGNSVFLELDELLTFLLATPCLVVGCPLHLIIYTNNI
jgi:hypothetical protein